MCLDDKPKSFAILWHYFLPRPLSGSLTSPVKLYENIFFQEQRSGGVAGMHGFFRAHEFINL